MAVSQQCGESRLCSMGFVTLCRAVGVFPLRGDEDALHFTIPRLVYSCALLAVSAAFQILFSIQESQVPHSSFFKHMSRTQKVLKFLIFANSLYFTVQNRELLSKYLNTVTTVQRKICGCSVVSKLRQSSKYFLGFMTWCVFYDSARSETWLNVFTKAVGLVAVHLPIVCSGLLFVHFIDRLRTSLEAINDRLNGTAIAQNKENGVEETLLQLAEAHYVITVMADNLNSAYSSIYFTHISGIVCILIIGVYKDATYLTELNFSLALEQVFWSVFWFVLLTSIILPAAQATQLSKDFNVKLSHLVVKHENAEWEYEDETPHATRLRVHVDSEFVASFSCGYFQLDRYLIQSIISGIGSFSVILVQISSEDNSDEGPVAANITSHG